VISLVKNYAFISVFTEHLTNYIEQKRSLGFSFNLQSYWLYRFDKYCVSINLCEPSITKKLIDDWMTSIPNDGKHSKCSRLAAIKGFLIYLNTIGIDAYVPHAYIRAEKTIPYLLSDSEIKSFFESLDNRTVNSPVKRFKQLSVEYKVFFRLMYCCGLRNSEVCNAKIEDINLSDGTLEIKQSKGRKDRIVYLPDDIIPLLADYLKYLKAIKDNPMIWLFPGRDLGQPCKNTSMDKLFKDIWDSLGITINDEKTPTMHCFRHHFVVTRMNLWMKDDTVKFNSMLPYLSNYLGHKSPSETFYYYHQVQEAFEIVESKDTLSKSIIPEVKHE
jgi:integrase/recombinase XerD